MSDFRLGAPVFVIPDGRTDYVQIIAENNVVTAKDGLQAGMRLLCRTFFGYAIGVVSMDTYGQPRCMSDDGSTAYFLDFVDGGWSCFGSGNMACLEKLELYGQPAEKDK